MRVVSFRVYGVIAVGLAIVLAATAAQAQGPQRGGRPSARGGMVMGQMDLFRLIGIEQVQKEIGLTDEQKAELDKLREEMRRDRGAREGMEGLRDLSPEERRERMEEMRKKFQEEAAKRAKETEAKLAELLKPEQLLRLKQIQLQLGGVYVLQRPEVAEHLGLSEDQKTQLKTISDESAEEMRKLFGSARGQDVDREKIREQMQQLNADVQKKSMAVLNDEQKQKFAEMMGEPFELDRSAMWPRGGDRRGEGRDGQRGQRGQRDGQRGQPRGEQI